MKESINKCSQAKEVSLYSIEYKLELTNSNWKFMQTTTLVAESNLAKAVEKLKSWLEITNNNFSNIEIIKSIKYNQVII